MRKVAKQAVKHLPRKPALQGTRRELPGGRPVLKAVLTAQATPAAQGPSPPCPTLDRAEQQPEQPHTRRDTG